MRSPYNILMIFKNVHGEILVTDISNHKLEQNLSFELGIGPSHDNVPCSSERSSVIFLTTTIKDRFGNVRLLTFPYEFSDYLLFSKATLNLKILVNLGDLPYYD